MGTAEVWDLIAAERAALAADVGPLTDEQWQTASLCDGWTVRDVLAHMVSTAEMTPGRFVGRLVGSGFSLERLQAKDIAELTQGPPADTVARFTADVHARTHPPGPAQSWLGETIVHGEDIRRPLGIAHTYDPAAVTTTLDFYRKSNLVIGGKKRAAGLAMRATDVDWSAGSGPDVSGPAVSLALALTGRPAVLGDLTGDGVAVIRDRMP